MVKNYQTKTNEQLTSIPYGTHPKVLLLGNGVNRTFGDDSWNRLLDCMSCEHYEAYESYNLENLPYPLKVVTLTGDNVDEGVKLVADQFMPKEIPCEQKKLISNFVDLSFDAILTTNYSYEIEKTIEPDFACKMSRSSKYRKKTFSGKRLDDELGLYKYMSVKSQCSRFQIWHIHGEAARIKSMVIGHYYYGNLLSGIKGRMASLIKEKKACDKYQSSFTPKSWIDYFMLGDVYIVGLGLDFSELDLWWLINCKKRHNERIGGGSIYWFEPNLDKPANFAKRKLADAYTVKCFTENIEPNEYKKYYVSVSEQIKNIMM